MKAIALLLSVMLVSSLALAQQRVTGPAAVKGQRISQLQNALGLSDGQVAEMRAIREAGGGVEDMRAVLTPEQQARMAAMKTERAAERTARQADKSEQQVPAP